MKNTAANSNLTGGNVENSAETAFDASITATENATASSFAADEANERAAYQGEIVLTARHRAAADTWQTGLNNNVLVLGASGAGKTRNHLKPNLLQAQGSYIVLDSKGTLYRDMAPYLRKQGYQVDQLDFTTMSGTIGYNPLDHIRYADGVPLQQDIITIASAICPREDHGSDPFWPLAAANYLASYIAYVIEALPKDEQNMASVIRLFEGATAGRADKLFSSLEEENPESYAARLHRRAQNTCVAEKMHSSIMGIIAANLLPLGFDGAIAAYQCENRVDFTALGCEKRALFVTIDDMDQSLNGLTSLFVRQAFSTLCDFADNQTFDGRLPVPVRFMLDDFANLSIPNFDNVLSVVRSREISCTVICQTVSQLEARFGEAAANSIIGNCDRQLVMGFQDEATARYFSFRANKPASSLFATPRGKWWLFERGSVPVLDDAYALESHPAYPLMVECQAEDAWYPEDWFEEADYEEWGPGFEEIDPEDYKLFAA